MNEILIKNSGVFLELIEKRIHRNLKLLLVWLMERKDVYFTGGYEVRDYPSVHSTDPLRGIDIRSSIYLKPEEVELYINNNWVYDPDRKYIKVAKFHDTGRGEHIHLQVHGNTRLIGNE